MNKYMNIESSKADGIGWIVFNRPEKYNAFNEGIMEEINDAITDYGRDRNVKVVVFQGKGKSFASGADISDLQKMGPNDALFPTMQTLYEKIYKFPKPTIAAVQGYAMGGGMELAASCDIRIATENAKFGLPECRLGVMPGAGGTQRLVRILGEAKVKELVILGEHLDAYDAKKIGFLTKVVPQNELENEILSLASKIMERGALALQMSKMSIQLSLDIPQEVGCLLENLSQAFLFSTKDKNEGVTAFLEKRKANFVGE